MSVSTLLGRWTLAAGLTLGVLGGGAALAGAAADTSTSPSDEEAEDVCTDQQIEGGYEEIGDRCQLTGHDWDFGGLCPEQRDAEIGRLGDGDCQPTEPGGDGPVGPGNPWEPPVHDNFTPPSFEVFDQWCIANGGTLSTAEVDGFVGHTCHGAGRDIFCYDFDGLGTGEPIRCIDQDLDEDEDPFELPGPTEPTGPIGTEVDGDVPTRVDPTEPADPSAPFEHEAPADPVMAGEDTTPASTDSPTVDGAAPSTTDHQLVAS